MNLRITKKSVLYKIRFYLCNDFSINVKVLKRKKIRFPHPIGIVIGKGVVIGEECTIYQNVTIGAKSVEESTVGLYPVIGDNVIIGAGSLIIGDIKLGNGCYIGAGAIVTKDVPTGAKVIGVNNIIKSI